MTGVTSSLVTGLASSTAITPAAFALGTGTIRRFEGLRLSVYWDPNGRCWSIGYGMCRLPGDTLVTAHTPALTAAQAVSMLETKLRVEYAPDVEKACKGACLPDSAWAALLDFAWNLGDPCLERSGIGVLLAKGEVQAAAARVKLYNRSGGKVLAGLVTRRAAEAEMLLGASQASLASAGSSLPAAGASLSAEAAHPTTAITADELDALYDPEREPA